MYSEEEIISIIDSFPFKIFEAMDVCRKLSKQPKTYYRSVLYTLHKLHKKGILGYRRFYATNQSVWYKIGTTL